MGKKFPKLRITMCVTLRIRCKVNRRVNYVIARLTDKCRLWIAAPPVNFHRFRATRTVSKFHFHLSRGSPPPLCAPSETESSLFLVAPNRIGINFVTTPHNSVRPLPGQRFQPFPTFSITDSPLFFRFFPQSSRVLEAERWFLRARRLAPDDSSVHHHYGTYHLAH